MTKQTIRIDKDLYKKLKLKLIEDNQSFQGLMIKYIEEYINK